MKYILLIDDEEDFCYLTKMNLEAEGEFKVTISSNSDEAIELVRKLKPDLILMDILMPGISGPEIAKMLRDDLLTATIPIVFLTAIVTKEDTQSGNVISGWPFVPKPVKIKELVKVINENLK